MYPLQMAAENTMRIVVIGDSCCGKTSLINNYLRGYSPEIRSFPNCNEYRAHVPHPTQDGVVSVLFVEITPDVHCKQRCEAYDQPDRVLMCYALNDRNALPQIKEMWSQEIRLFLPPCPVYLVGMKVDLRDSNSAHVRGSLIPYRTGLNLKVQYSYKDYMECSGLTGIGVNELLNRVLFP